ncbi:MAG TPA: DUF47 family protein [Candidatus Limiplasma sp.]|jgi:uncharacterized protein Yka (UPF0111/DUF47 family)|nr:DUF47 family protein [Candidatus Limiplasma sp.]
MAKKTDNFYFNNFIESAGLSCDAAEMLKAVLVNFDLKKLPEQRAQLHEIEHKGDNTRHELIHKLVSAFITPIERDDLTKLSQNIDDVTDAIEDILIRIYMTNITTIRPDSIDFADLVIHCCCTMKEMLCEFANFKKSKKLKDLIIELNRLEEVGDEKYLNCMRNLHTACNDPIEIIAWREIYDIFERCCDTCENVADIVEGITIGNS